MNVLLQQLKSFIDKIVSLFFVIEYHLLRKE